jgi:two-component system, OmpR family, sensor kinase
MTVVPERNESLLLATLERLLQIEATDVATALNAAAEPVGEALGADKVDVFLFDPATSSLVAVGQNDTPLSAHQRAVGLDRLPVANGGRTVEVYETGRPYLTAQADQDPAVLRGVRETLGVRSMIAVPLDVSGERRGVLAASSQQPDLYGDDDLRFLEAVARWVGIVAHRAELVEQLRQETAEQTRRVVARELVEALAHDLQNLISPLLWHIDLIRRNAQREERARELRSSTQALAVIRRMHTLVRDLLDESRLEQGLFTLSLQTVNLAALVRESAGILQTRDAPVEVRAPNELLIQVDAERVRQAVENLLSNAQRYSPGETPVTVEVRADRREDGPWVTVKVHDEGPGIDPEVLPLLFERFVAGQGSRGLGIGLYLARQIARAHGGELAVDSAPGQGTTFYLSLPANPV